MILQLKEDGWRQKLAKMLTLDLVTFSVFLPIVAIAALFGVDIMRPSSLMIVVSVSVFVSLRFGVRLILTRKNRAEMKCLVRIRNTVYPTQGYDWILTKSIRSKRLVESTSIDYRIFTGDYPLVAIS